MCRLPGMFRTLNGPARLLNRMNVRCSAGAREGDADHAVARDNPGKLLLGPILSALGLHRKDHEAAFLIGVLDAYLHLRRKY